MNGPQFLLLLFLVALPGATLAESPSHDVLRRAQVSALEGRHEEARSLLEAIAESIQATGSRPERAAFHHVSALLAIRQERYAAAIPHLERVLKFGADPPVVSDDVLRNSRRTLASLYDRDARFSESEPIFRLLLARALQSGRSSDQSHANLQLGRHFALRFEHERALAFFVEAEKLASSSAAARALDAGAATLALANLHARMGNQEDAASTFSRILRDPRTSATYIPDAALGLASILAERGDVVAVDRVLDQGAASVAKHNGIESERVQEFSKEEARLRARARTVVGSPGDQR